MKNKTKIFGAYLPIFTLFLIATVTIRTVALFLHFDANLGFFSQKALISVSDYMVIAISVFFLSYIFTAKKDIKLVPDFTSPATYIPTGIVSVALVFMVVSLFIRLFNTMDFIRELKEENTLSSLSAIPMQRVLVFVLIITAILALLSIVHFVLIAIVENHSNTKRANFGICTILFLSIYTIYLYFSTELPLNAPNKALDQMAYLFAAVFFLYETRLSLGREKWRQYIAFGFIASTISAYASIPALIYYFAEGTVVSNSVYELVLTFSLFVFITSRFLLTGNLIEDTPSDVVSNLILSAEARAREINPEPAAPLVIDVEGEALAEDNSPTENQITIDDISSETQPPEADGSEIESNGRNTQIEAPTDAAEEPEE